jgi:hypothetical protein
MAKDKDGRDLGTIEGLLIDEAERKVRFMEVGSGGFLGLGESKSLIPVEAITRMTPDAVYIGHTREHVAGAPRYDPELVAHQNWSTSSTCSPTTGTRRPSGYPHSWSSRQTTRAPRHAAKALSGEVPGPCSVEPSSSLLTRRAVAGSPPSLATWRTRPATSR